MSAIPYERHEDERATTEPEAPAHRRRRRARFGRGGAAVAALVLGIAGFYVGVHVEKGEMAATSATRGLTLPSAATSANSGSGGRAATSRSGFPGADVSGAGNLSLGTVRSVRAKTIYVELTSGNTIKVTLSSATKITKSQTVARKAVRPGDSVVIQGATNSNGSVAASSVTDSGASTSSAATTSGGGSNSSGGGVGSLFSSPSGG